LLGPSDVPQSVMETDKENTSSYLQTSFQSPAVAHSDRCNAGSASHASTMRPLTSGMRTAAAESEVTLIHIYLCLCYQLFKSVALCSAAVCLDCL